MKLEDLEIIWKPKNINKKYINKNKKNKAMQSKDEPNNNQTNKQTNKQIKKQTSKWINQLTTGTKTRKHISYFKMCGLSLILTINSNKSYVLSTATTEF